MPKGFFEELTDIEKEYLQRTKTSYMLDQEATSFLPGGSTRSATDSKPYPVYMKSGKGCYLLDADENEYIDFMNNYTVLILGHAHPKVCEAISNQTQSGILLGAPSREQFELGKMICDRVDSVDKVRFCNTGTEAVMYSIRVARAVTGKTKVLKFEGGFHGNTEQTEISVGPDLKDAGPPERPYAVPETEGITPGVLQDVRIAPYNNIDATREIIEENKNDLAAVIVEPLLGAAGMIPATGEFLKFLREVTDQHQLILIFDEIITYRLSPGGVQEIFGIKPDLTTFGKIIGGGLPIGAFGGREDIMDIFSPKRDHPMHHSGTFNGGAVTMAAGIAAMNEIDASLISRINQMGEELKSQLARLFSNKGVRGQLTGRGSLMNIHFSSEEVANLRTAKADWKTSLPLRDLLNLALKNRGIYTPNRLMLCISSPMTENEIQTVLAAFDSSLDQLKPVIEKYCPEFLL